MTGPVRAAPLHLGIEERRDDGLVLSDDPARLDLDTVHGWLSAEAYWALGRTRDVTGRAVAGSWNLGVYDGARQVAFARVVTDAATFGWLCDVFVAAGVRGRGVGGWLVDTVRDTLTARGVHRIVLVTRDAHAVYARAGFTPLRAPERLMELDTRT